MSTETNAESAQNGVQTTSASESGPPDSTIATPAPESSPGTGESTEATPKPGPAREAFGTAIQRLAGTSDNLPDAESTSTDAEEQVDPEARIAEATARAEAAERVANQYHAAAQAGLPLDLAGRLQGATVEEMIADAQTLKTHLAPPRVQNIDPHMGGGSEPIADGRGGFGQALADQYSHR